MTYKSLSLRRILSSELLYVVERSYRRTISRIRFLFRGRPRRWIYGLDAAPPPPTPLRNGPNGPVDVTIPVTGVPEPHGGNPHPRRKYDSRRAALPGFEFNRPEAEPAGWSHPDHHYLQPSRNPGYAPTCAYMAALDTNSPSLGMRTLPVDPRREKLMSADSISPGSRPRLPR